MAAPASSNTVEIYMQAHKETSISATLDPPKVWNQFVHDV